MKIYISSVQQKIQGFK